MLIDEDFGEVVYTTPCAHKYEIIFTTEEGRPSVFFLGITSPYDYIKMTTDGWESFKANVDKLIAERRTSSHS